MARTARSRLLRQSLTLAIAASVLGPLASTSAGAQDASLPRLYTNERFVDDVNRRSTLDVENIESVLEYVLGQLPPRVRVYPTENYYYFYFYHGGIKYAGNLRFDVEERDKGFVEFIYFKDSTDWLEDERDYHATLGAEDGVLVEKVEDLVYRVSFAGRSVVFELNDLSKVTPPAGTLSEDETFLGPVSDESGIRLFLVFNEKLKLFHYVLDETVPVADELVEAVGMSHVVIGRRTGFAFLKDPGAERKLLIGVYGPNIGVNNYLDGPFDQLPDNFLKGDELRRALLLARPDIERPIDRLGIAPGGQYRESISPYLHYFDVEELAPAEKCAAEQMASAVYLCLDALFDE
jgi:hypothetical protein